MLARRTVPLRIILVLMLGMVMHGTSFATFGLASGGPENVILAVNQNSAASLAVANLYIELRQIPPSNVVYLDLPFAADDEQITLAEFRKQILIPIIEQIAARRLESQIDYIIYSADFPTAISVNEDLEQLKAKQPDLSPEQIKILRPVASINALTYFAGAVLAKEPSYLSLNANWYMRQSLDAALQTPFLGDEDRNFRSALVKIHTGEYDQALGYLEPLAQAHPFQFATWLEIVRCRAGLTQSKEAAAALLKLADTGWGHRSEITKMKEFQRIAGDADVESALEVIPDEDARYVSSQSFRRTYYWGRNGGRNGTPEQGRNYILSTVLAVTRNNGTSLADALEYLRTSAAADFTHPKGDFYFSLNGDVRTTTRQPGIESAVAGLKDFGFTATVTKERVPANKKNVAGAILGDKGIQWPPSQSQIIPGAIIDNLTSFGGKMKGDHHTPATDFLKWGAAGSSGTVTEPFAIQAKFADPMILVHYARGCTLAEAYYQSVHGPFQLLIVGDALCQPWATPVSFELVGLKPGSRISGRVNLQVQTRDPASISQFELYLDGVRSGVTPLVGKFSFNADDLSDGYHELRVVAIAAGPLETRSRQVIPFIVDHGGKEIQLVVEPSQIPLEGKVKVTVQSPWPGPIQINQNGRALATVAQSGESVELIGSTFGLGNSQLIAAATVDGKRVQCEPVPIRVHSD